MDFTSERVVVLGGTSGIGLATAVAAARRGASVVVASSRRKNVDAALSVLPVGSEGYVVDVADEDDVRHFFREVGTFHHLVFTAGDHLRLGSIDQFSSSEAKEAFTIRFWGAWLAAKYARGHLAAGGSIVLSSGIAGTRPQPGSSAVASVCGAVEALTRALAVEYAPVRVNAVSAGPVRTNLWSDVDESRRDVVFAEIGRTLPVGKVAEASEVAKAYLYLMSERFSTGAVLTLDGGSTLK